MESGPQIRIVGNASEEQKQEANDKIVKLLFDHFESLEPAERAELERSEYPKSVEELVIIDFANRETNELMVEAGIEPYDIPAENYHIIPRELYKKAGGGGSATAFTTQQGIIFDARSFRGNPVSFGATAMHETLHLKAHLSLEVSEKGKDTDTTHYRQGVSVKSLQKHGYSGGFHEHFHGLHEAIVANQEKRSIGKLLELPELSKEKEWLSSDEAKKLKEELSKKKNIPEEDIVWVDEKDKNNYDVVSYRKQRVVLDYVCDEIQKQFSEQYKSSDEVFKEFLKSNFTGHLLPIARLVEKTFGEGSFRILGNMDTDSGSGVLHLESFKKARARQEKLLKSQFDNTPNNI